MKSTRRSFFLSTAGALSVSATSAAEVPRQGLWTPKLSENLADVNPDTLRWLSQLGCKHVIFQGTDSVDTERKGYWAPGEVRAAKSSCEKAGLILESMMIPIDFYKKARLGQ